MKVCYDVFKPLYLWHKTIIPETPKTKHIELNTGKDVEQYIENDVIVFKHLVCSYLWYDYTFPLPVVCKKNYTAMYCVLTDSDFTVKGNLFVSGYVICNGTLFVEKNFSCDEFCKVEKEVKVGNNMFVYGGVLSSNLSTTARSQLR